MAIRSIFWLVFLGLVCGADIVINTKKAYEDLAKGSDTNITLDLTYGVVAKDSPNYTYGGEKSKLICVKKNIKANINFKISASRERVELLHSY